MTNFDIIIVGGGHAGVEAAYIASQFKNLNIALISMPGVGLASAPCNPAVGGVGKGQVVREIDALGGLIGKLADRNGIQFRTLNDSKGFAVQSTRIQIDKDLYTIDAEELLNKIENLTIIKEKIKKISTSGGTYSVSSKSSTWNSKKLVLTIGTFLNGKMHTGSKVSLGGRVDCESSDSINDMFEGIKTLNTRFKTGTPARLDSKTIDYDLLEEQPSDDTVDTFHVLHGTKERFVKQVSCYLAYTNLDTMQIIRDNREKSPLFNGQIEGVGARYCPSIEDKAYRYPDKNKHHVFIEPEGLSTNTVYPSGISTSLPEKNQEELVQTIVGLSNSKIVQHGYAVEYDVLDTTQLDLTLQMRDMPGLYFAGQVNGTSGYEEAAGQGYIAGVNAALSVLSRKPMILSRNESYIGVMVEDLVSNVRDEPYRLFTARSENRLFIREDNAINRMCPHRTNLELEEDIDRYSEIYMQEYQALLEVINSVYIDSRDEFIKKESISVPRRIKIAELIKQSNLNPITTLVDFLEFYGLNYDRRVVRSIAIATKYEGYINKSDSSFERMKKLEEKVISWSEIVSSENISFECKQRIEKIRPENFGQLKRIDGIRQATLTAVVGSYL